jgi:hypothetical protein
MVVAPLADWLGALPHDGTSNAESQHAESILLAELEMLDVGDDLDQRTASLARQLMDSVNQRRASVRGEN